MRKWILLLALVCTFIPALPVRAAGQPLNIYFAGPNGGLHTALGLDKDVRFTTDPAQADAFVLNGQIPAGDAGAILARVQAGAGLVLVLGPTWSNLSSGTVPRRCVSATF